MGLFKSAWQSANPQKRIKAIEKITDQEVLKNLAASDPVLEVRLAAIKGISNEHFLAMLANEMNNKSITDAVITKLTSQDILFSLAIQGKANEIVSGSTIKLALMGDKRIISNFKEIKSKFITRGDADYYTFLHEAMKAFEKSPSNDVTQFIMETYYADPRVRLS